MYNKTLRCLILLATSLLAMNVYAGKDGSACDEKESHPKHMKHRMPHENKMVRQLDMSEEQQQQFSALRQENKSKLHVQYEALRDNRRQMHELIASGAYSEEKAAQLAEQQGSITAEMARLRAAEMAKLYSLLTPDQQKKFAAMKFEQKPASRRRHGERLN